MLTPCLLIFIRLVRVKVRAAKLIQDEDHLYCIMPCFPRTELTLAPKGHRDLFHTTWPHKPAKVINLLGIKSLLKLNMFFLSFDESHNIPHRIVDNETIGDDKDQEKFTSHMNGGLNKYVLFIFTIESIYCLNISLKYQVYTFALVTFWRFEWANNCILVLVFWKPWNDMVEVSI